MPVSHTDIKKMKNLPRAPIQGTQNFSKNDALISFKNAQQQGGKLKFTHCFSKGVLFGLSFFFADTTINFQDFVSDIVNSRHRYSTKCYFKYFFKDNNTSCRNKSSSLSLFNYCHMQGKISWFQCRLKG